MIYSNKFKCGSKLWRQFGWPGRAVYNELYAAMRKRGTLEPNTKSYAKSLVSNEDWEIICHNAAWKAGQAADKAAERFAT